MQIDSIAQQTNDSSYSLWMIFLVVDAIFFFQTCSFLPRSRKGKSDTIVPWDTCLKGPLDMTCGPKSCSLPTVKLKKKRKEFNKLLNEKGRKKETFFLSLGIFAKSFFFFYMTPLGCHKHNLGRLVSKPIAHVSDGVLQCTIVTKRSRRTHILHALALSFRSLGPPIWRPMTVPNTCQMFTYI